MWFSALTLLAERTKRFNKICSAILIRSSPIVVLNVWIALCHTFVALCDKCPKCQINCDIDIDMHSQTLNIYRIVKRCVRCQLPLIYDETHFCPEYIAFVGNVPLRELCCGRVVSSEWVKIAEAGYVRVRIASLTEYVIIWIKSSKTFVRLMQSFNLYIYFICILFFLFISL